MVAAPADLDSYRNDVVVKDGQTVRIRPITPDDADALHAMWQRLSPETIRLRFFAPRSMTRAGIEYFTHLDLRDRFALVAEQRGRLIGVARFDRLVEDPEAAEFAVLVEDAEQGRGVGTALLRSLLQPAQDLGIRRFVGEVLSENRRMLQVMADAGLSPQVRTEGTVVHTEFTTTPTESFLAAADEQDRVAAVNALTHVFRPESIAVIGASRDPATIGGLVFANLLRGGFAGPVYPVNPSTSVVQSVAAYPSVAECPTAPECVVVCVPAPKVSEVVAQAAQAGSQAAVIVSAGFAEAGEAGAARERQVREIANRHGIRLIGPNCMGVLNAGADVRMNATFSQVFPPAGGVAFSSQSGALGLAVLAEAQRLGVGLSTFASIGNKADISGNDLLQFWEADDDTDVVLLYLESFGNPRKFGRLARRIGRHKPIVAVKSGRTSSGERAASSHTGALSAGDVAVDALFHQAGVVRCDSLEEMFHVAQLLSHQPLPTGRGVAVLTNGGGPGILAADACESHGLVVPELSESSVERLAELLPPEAGLRNPVDMVASAGAPAYGQAMRVLAADPAVSALLVIFIPPVVTDPADVAREVSAAATEINAERDPRVPVVGVFMNAQGSPAALTEARIPTFAFPEDAARALGRVSRYAEWRAAPLGNVVEVTDADLDTARAVVAEVLAEPGEGERDPASAGWLDAGQAERLLTAFGIDTAPSGLARSGEEAAALQAQLDAPVAVKVAAPVHKTEVGGVRLNLSDPEGVAAAVRDMDADLRARGRHDIADAGFMVQRMIGDGVEMVAGANFDPLFGHLLVAGMGGTLVELLGDVSVRIHPVTDVDVDEMLAGLRGFPLLTGYRGSHPVDVPALKGLVFRLSALIEHVPEVDELDLNPVFVRQQGVAAVDARIRVVSHEPPRAR